MCVCLFLKKRKRKKESYKMRVFWLNIAKSEIYLRYRYCSNLFSEMRKESESQQHRCWNSTKVWKRKRKTGREKILNFGNGVTEILAAQIPYSSVFCARSVNAQKKKTNCGNAIVEIGKKKFGNCGNAIAKNGRGK